MERRIPAPNQGGRIQARYEAIAAALNHPPRSAERAAEIARAAHRTGHSARSLQRWIAELEARDGDANALARVKPTNAGARRVFVSRPFDKAARAAGLDVATLAELAGVVDQLLKAAWASPAQRAGWLFVGREVVTAFKRECRDRGLQLPAAAFTLSRRRIEEQRDFRRVDIYRHDRKRFDDQKPRIRRDNSLFAPLEQVVMDVKPLDVMMERPDGSEVWPKMIAFQDTGTARIFPYIVMLPRGEGVRQEHVIEAFLEMVDHPDWGFPLQLYRDNGTEFAVFDRIRNAMAHVAEPGARTIINAKPYSGASKPIESRFAQLDRYVFSQMEGFTGGNRMNKKTQQVGKRTAPYRGDFEAFAHEAMVRIADAETIPFQSGPFAGRAPATIFADHLAKGWQPVRVDRLALDASFATFETRRVDRGVVTVKGQRYLHPELPNGRTITVALPWRRNAAPMAKLPELGWAQLQAEMLHLPWDKAGATEAGRLQTRDARRTRRAANAAGAIDLQRNLADRGAGGVAALPTRATPAPLMDVILSDQAEELGRSTPELSNVEVLHPVDSKAARRARRMAMIEENEALAASYRA